ncbi:MAG: decarboxylating NADP(+)-dependent phosphogluconate dehydrogenase [Paludisphaera borealis]|uniref:decarboxylating NADP(+)-dependent phosphogluconate dehydrogenase n=1 Tax=Paludisphaera borealis TaxID=1387353 RepID=UPI00284894C2|nr:decarboxylating NADP(+)-dependent phosphogluconate dehydrogenase [Paludisphaera borealis]MDR3620290.1 decarboxylating NADP(+)-dependent phosphogluconate dehydrogenase [Paludisphaera borealis]
MAATTPTADIGLIGLAVMGENLVLNMASHGFTVAVFNRTTAKVDAFLDGRAKGQPIVGAHTVQELVAQLKRPRKIMIMVKAGAPVDAVIDELVPLLEPGDVLIDGGNSHFPDSTRRTQALKEKGILYVGTGVSGGEEGALKGPSIMPGGNPDAWPLVKPIFQAIAAKVPVGTPCCDWVGPEGAGHFVKMVHNGIEYGDMQLICEAYFVMRKLLGMEPAAQHSVFERWNKGPLDSYLIEITRDILGYKDPETGKPMVDLILDTAGQKGTGKWTVISACDLGVPLTLISEAVFARTLSSQKDERVAASKVLKSHPSPFSGNRQSLVDDIEQALYASKIISYAQGFSLMNAMAKESNWEINNGGVALMWRGGCIIRSAFLGRIKEAFDRDPKLSNLLLDPFFTQEIARAEESWRRVCAAAITHGIALPAMTSALSYFDGYRSAELPANLLQAQRDYFGAHTYERTDKPRGQFFHTNWTGRGGDTASTSYNV